jgi:hypothetical protein
MILSDSTRDLIAVISFILTSLQVIVLVVQVWRSRPTSSTRFRFSMVMSDFGIRMFLFALTVGFLLNLVTTTGFYWGGLSGYENSRAWALMLPGIFLQSVGTVGFLTLLPDAMKEANASRKQGIGLLLSCSILTISYFVIEYTLPWNFSRWLDLFKITQNFTLAFVAFEIVIVGLPLIYGKIFLND